MSSSAAKLLATEFLRRTVARLRSVPPEQIAQWPDYPQQPDFDLNVPNDLAEYTFTLMKDTVENGDVRVGVQCLKPGRLGTSQMSADGFVVSANGEMRSLTEQDLWDLT
jgi:hypothetical protein